MIKDEFKKWVHYKWHGMRQRSVNSGCPLFGSAQLATYHRQGILLLMTKAQFVAWCYDHKNIINKMNRPSIDRVDPSKHYSIDNIRIREFSKNRADGLNRLGQLLQKPVICKDPVSKQETFFKSMREANLHGFRQGCISRAIMRNNKHRGFFWSFYDGATP